ncbi:TDP-N-acetylfucosamine:lipid II N-acetylfucosaminyltransferase [Halomonas vilamensis]|uniref:protein O-GlcNAc transferase n=1 Tax=Vreelandella vilamensis TaxID=531309 RepID=A0ABU1H5A5_9GAMM|nr:TDP-N-acetylfucosamine:lipid II N-acetylfucosaminyltransferase [Halomonas vilamensis]MDR5899471.1 TDP-N-acetylfucosamine:lipid II N-acetylfucosaminyltransferase [Halomonas vilamensis]
MVRKNRHIQNRSVGKPLSLAKLRQQTERQPHNANAWIKLAQWHLEKDELDEAYQTMAKAEQQLPESHEILEWLGYIEYKRHKPKEALKYLELSQTVQPNSVFCLTTLAKIYFDAGKLTTGLDYIEKAEHLSPKDIRVLDTKGKILNGLFRLEEAKEVFLRLIELNPDSHVHWNSLGNVMRDLGNLDSAIAYYKKSEKLTGKDPIPYSNWLTSLHYDAEVSREEIEEVINQWEVHYAPQDPPKRPLAENLDPSRRLRIGMLSDGFRSHPVGKMIVRFLEHFNSEEAELFAYSTSDIKDSISLRLQSCIDHWLSINQFSDKALYQKMRDDKIDILIDLSGHNTGNRMKVIAMQPAPLLMKWVGGLINTTGVKSIDYLISDSIETPKGEDKHYTEKLIRLPDDYIIFDPPKNLPNINELPAKRNGYITLACFNNPIKINHKTLVEWSKIMHQLPGSKLLLKGRAYSSEAFCEHLYTQLEAEGISRERLLIEGPGANHEMLDAYNQADIALDPWPYSGGLTTCEAFLMGVPVVSLPGPTFAGRHSATHLVNAGMPELVVNSWDEYHERVLELASDLDSLATIRTHLRDVLLQSPVCDGPRFTYHLTKALRAIWQRYCEGKAPEALTFNKQGEAWFEGEDAPVEVQHPESQEVDVGFTWNLAGKIITLDNSAKLIRQKSIEGLRKLNAFGIVAFDPTSQVKKPQQFEGSEDVQVLPHAALGDGQPATLHACLDPAFSSTLEPLPPEQQHAANPQGARVLTKLPINTIALDSIEGLESLDWLILDDLSDATAILEHGEKALKDTLAIQVRIAFQPTHQRQPNLAEIQHWMARHGFRFYRFNDQQYLSHLPENVPAEKRQATELQSADALFLPSYERMAVLTDNQRTKLAFLLHTVYGIKDMAYGLLKEVDEAKAEGYLIEEGMADKRDQITNDKPLKEGKKIIHICFNNMHVQPLVDILTDHDIHPSVEHDVYVERSRSIPNYDIDISNNPKAHFFDQKNDLIKIKSLCLKDDVVGIFFHGMFFDWQKKLVKYIGEKKKTVWVMWGGDLYNPIKNNIDISDVVQSLYGVATWWDGDFSIFTKYYGPKERVPFLYSLGDEWEVIDDEKIEKENRIVLGNSGDPSNNHLDILKELSTKSDIKKYKIVLPFSYNAPEGYKDKIIKSAISLNIANQVSFIEEKRTALEYFRFLAQSMFVIMAHDRQQGGANIVASLLYGNATVVKKKIKFLGKNMQNPLWEKLAKNGEVLFSYDFFCKVDSLREVFVSEEQKKKQREIAFKSFGKEVVINKMFAGFDKIVKSNNFYKMKAPEVFFLGNQKSGTTAIAALVSEAANKKATLDIKGGSKDFAWQKMAIHDGNALIDFLERHQSEMDSDIVKEPALSVFLDTLIDLFPDSKFVLIIRNPYQNIRSILNRLGVPGSHKKLSYEDYEVFSTSPAWKYVVDSNWLGCDSKSYIESLANRWNYIANLAIENKDRIKIVKYEDFVKDKKYYIENLVCDLGFSVEVDVENMVDKQFQPKGNRDVDVKCFFREDNYNLIRSICNSNAEKLGYFL